MQKEKKILIGTSGFSYNEWKGTFYPEELPPKEYLGFYAQHFQTTEINNTFYKIPSRTLTEGWYKAVPSSFSFTLKLSQRITHQKRLKNADQEMELFLEGAAELREKLGPVLVQLPPYYRKEEAAFAEFVSAYANRARLAFEFRHESWFDETIYDILRKNKCALVVVETEEAPAKRIVTGSFIYVRLRKGDYSKEELAEWTQWIKNQPVDVYCYVKHDERAPIVAQEMLQNLKVDN
jgi:uncharacterized protein YecE (DUF72 family)